ncbi:MAG: DUF2569 family protein [Patescibacteria group bacterium]|jgi:hypothetical protein|nr:DUF2569 family protein [Patescibacteria group bacterium]
MECSKCKTNNDDKSKVCRICGADLTMVPAAIDFKAGTESSSAAEKYQGLGGWLILVGLGLISAPLMIGWALYQDFLPLVLESQVWQTLTSPGSLIYSSLWKPTLMMEVTVNIIFFVWTIYLLVLFFRKSAHFPKLYIIFLAVNLLFLMIDDILLFQIRRQLPILGQTVGEQKFSSLSAVLPTVIWIPYMLNSKRVKQTFVN